MRKRIALSVLLITVLFVLTRLPGLKIDAINPDGVNWHYRSEQFMNGIKFLQFEKTYQHYHPGVTLMWLTGVPIEIYKQVSGVKVYDMSTFLNFHLVAKLSLVVAQWALSILILLLLEKRFGLIKATATVLLFTLEPFFVGNSRLYHMDVLLSLLLFVSLLLAFEHLKKPNRLLGVFTGLFLALAFLTKSIAIGAVLYVVGVGFLYYIRNFKVKKSLKFACPIVISVVAFTFLLFPALWVKPAYYLSEIFSESERVGIRNGHDQIIFGKATEDGGFMFYPLVLLLKMSPLTLLGLGLYVIFVLGSKKKKAKDKKMFKEGAVVFLSVFYLVYYFVMFIPTKKIDRYMLPLYPWLALLAVLGFSYLYKSRFSENEENNKKAFGGVMAFLVLIFIAAPLVEQYPYYFTYTSPMFGTAATANKIIAQKPFGIATVELKNHILSTYSDGTAEGYPNLGFYDTKPMRSIYPNSKVFDVRVNGVSDYDLLILAADETTPEKVLASNSTFEKSSAITINGLEYWRIYAKRETE